MIGDIIRAITEAAVIEAQTVPRLLERDGMLFWRCIGGSMCRMTTEGRFLAMRLGVA